MICFCDFFILSFLKEGAITHSENVHDVHEYHQNPEIFKSKIVTD